MRLAVPALLATCLAACAAPPEGPDAPERSTFRGTFSGSCSPGDVFVMLDEREDAAWLGTMHFESATDHRRATYRVRGEVGEGSLRVTQTEIEEFDPIPNSWCLGSYDFAVGHENTAMTGTYTPTNCDCDGTASVEALD